MRMPFLSSAPRPQKECSLAEKPKTSNTISEINEAKKEEDQDNKDIQIVRDSEEKAKYINNKKKYIKTEINKEPQILK